jgi:hypothetical protein
MRFPCPQCGYSDNWKPCAFDYEAEFCLPEDLAPADPKELSQLKPGDRIEIGRYAYRMTRNLRIYRAAIPYANVNSQFGHSMMENPKNRRSPHADQSGGIHSAQESKLDLTLDNWTKPQEVGSQ